VGLGNYTSLWQDGQFHQAILNTFTIGLMSTVPQLLLALGIAHLLNFRMRGRTLLRVAILVPYATSVAAASLVFTQLFGRDYGLVNWVLSTLGASPVDWEPGRWSSQIAISFIITWRWTGYNALIYLAGMQSIPPDLYEAAAIDGANRWQQFRHVTVPSLRPAIVFTVVNSTIGALQIFGEPRLFGGPGAGGIAGGASNQYQTIGLLLYQQGWSFGQLGLASATAYSMFVIILVVAILNGSLATGRLTRFVPGRRNAR
jgi:cellobiose transport system permease protein